MKYANFGHRLVAYMIDGLLLSACGWILGFIFGFGYVSAFGVARGAEVMGNSLAVIAAWLYFAGCESSKHQGTIGKRIVGIRVSSQDGGRVTFGKATIRHFSKILSSIILGIGFLMIFFTKKRQALHDKIAHTVVIRRS